MLDGNGRWGRARGLPRVAGRRGGAEAVRRTIVAAAELGIRYLTLFGFSSENWKRPITEVNDLMGLLRHYLRGEIAELHRNSVRVRIIGDRSRLAADIVALIENAEATTRANTGLNLVVALSYGGRAELAAAARTLATRAAAGAPDPSAIDGDALARALSTARIPDPHLLLPSSGEQRVTNILLWPPA